MAQPKFPFKTIEEAGSLRGKRVIVRASLNVPLVDGVVRDDFRVAEACETIKFLQKEGARVVVLGHIGREPHESLAPVHTSMEKCTPHQFVASLTNETAIMAAAKLSDGDVLLLENVRSDVREVTNDEGFAQELAALGDIYVNDAFADSHRAHASVVGIPKYLPSYAGFVFAREYTELARAFSPEHPALFVLGGAKVETKLPLVERFAREYDHVFIGGAIANDFLKGRGVEIGLSVVSDVDLATSPLLSHERIILPQDVVLDGPKGKRTADVAAVARNEKIFDVGPASVAALAPYIAAAKTIVWNGPLGNYEGGYADGTNALARLIAEAPATSIIGGGDTIAAIESLGLEKEFTFVSTAGGAMLQFLETETLPGIEALKG